MSHQASCLHGGHRGRAVPRDRKQARATTRSSPSYSWTEPRGHLSSGWHRHGNGHERGNLVTSRSWIDRRRRNLLIGAAGLVGGRLSAPLMAAGAPGGGELPLVPRADVAPGLNISRVVKGCWQLSGGHKGDRSSDRTTGREAVEDFEPFVRAGITTFDTADIYGPSEEIIGRYVKASTASQSKPCEILTKYCCFGRSMNDVSASTVANGIERSKKRLNVDALDLVQVYWDDYGNKNYIDVMRHLYDHPSVKHVGVTNFDVKRLQEMVDAGVPPVMNQVQYSILDRRPENGMVEFCKEHNIKLLPYGVLAGGFLSEKYLGVPASSIRPDTYSKSKYASVLSQLGGWSWFQSLLEELQGVAQKHNTTIANVACKWVLDKPQVAAILAGARNATHVPDHQAAFLIKLDQDDRAKIDAVLQKGAQAKGDCYTWERGGVF